MLNNVQIKSLKIKGGAGTKPQGKPASNLVECVFHYLKSVTKIFMIS